VTIGDPSVQVLFLFGPPSDKEERVETSVLSKKEGGIFPKQVTVRNGNTILFPIAS